MKSPTLAEQREALVHAWLEVRQYVTPTRFREVIRGNERRVCAHVWSNLRRITETWSDAGKATRRWAALEAWALDETDGPALPALAGYDPTRGNTVPFEEFVGNVPPDDPDYPWGTWLDPAVVKLFGDEQVNRRLRALGWTLSTPRPLAKCGNKASK